MQLGTTVPMSIEAYQRSRAASSAGQRSLLTELSRPNALFLIGGTGELVQYHEADGRNVVLWSPQAFYAEVRKPLAAAKIVVPFVFQAPSGTAATIVQKLGLQREAGLQQVLGLPAAREKLAAWLAAYDAETQAAINRMAVSSPPSDTRAQKGSATSAIQITDTTKWMAVGGLAIIALFAIALRRRASSAAPAAPALQGPKPLDQRDIRRIFKRVDSTVAEELRREGWMVTKTKGGHYRWAHPNGSIAFAASTPSDHRSWKNFLANLRRLARSSGRK